LTAYISTWRRCFGGEFGRHPLDLDERDRLPVDAHPVVGELAFDLVFGGEVGVLVEAQRVAQEVGDQQAGVALVGVAGGEVGERLAEAAQAGAQPLTRLGLPFGRRPRGGLLRGFTSSASASTALSDPGTSFSDIPPPRLSLRQPDP
jgi:hypothetical protein